MTVCWMGRLAPLVPLFLAILTPLGAQQVVAVRPDAPLGAEVGIPDQESFLQSIMKLVDAPVEIRLASGIYNFKPASFVEATCGNCQDPDTEVLASVGMVVSGRGIRLVGASPDSVVFVTNAGYGLLFEDCQDCGLSGVTITGGVRDGDPQATDGAVVVRRSSVELQNCVIRDNIGNDSVINEVVVGIAGVVGREGSEIDIYGCRIERNSWDGIALYRGASANISDKLIDGVDNAGGAAGGGRGVGIGVTWNATANIERNLVRRYWKGIGIFVNAHGLIADNVVEDMLTWGIAFWGADSTGGSAVIRDNVIFHTGACGVILDRPSGGYDPVGSLTDNLFVQTGQNERYDSGEPYCTQRPIARDGVPDGFVVSNNLFHDNRQPGEGPRETDVSREQMGLTWDQIIDRLRKDVVLSESRALEFLRGR